MSEGFVLSIVHPPEEGAKYGKAVVSEPLPERRGEMFKRTYWALRNRDSWMHPEVANKAAEQVMRAGIGEEVVEGITGLRFRTDLAENAPHACPCKDGCGRLVLPTDHAYADAEDAFCDGCFTWSRTIPACLPGNSAHAQRKGEGE